MEMLRAVEATEAEMALRARGVLYLNVKSNARPSPRRTINSESDPKKKKKKEVSRLISS